MSKIVSSIVAAGLALATAAPASAATLFTLTLGVNTGYDAQNPTSSASKTALDNPLWTLTNSAGSLGANTIITKLVLNIVHDSGETFFFDNGTSSVATTAIARTVSDANGGDNTGSTTLTWTFTPTSQTSTNAFSIGEVFTFATELDRVQGAGNFVDYRLALNNATAEVTYRLANQTTQTATTTINFANPNGTSFSFANQIAADVPEPTSWAMMIGGFGMIGASLRRRRSLSVRFA